MLIKFVHFHFNLFVEFIKLLFQLSILYLQVLILCPNMFYLSLFLLNMPLLYYIPPAFNFMMSNNTIQLFLFFVINCFQFAVFYSNALLLVVFYAFYCYLVMVELGFYVVYFWFVFGQERIDWWGFYIDFILFNPLCFFLFFNHRWLFILILWFKIIIMFPSFIIEIIVWYLFFLKRNEFNLLIFFLHAESWVPVSIFYFIWLNGLSILFTINLKVQFTFSPINNNCDFAPILNLFGISSASLVWQKVSVKASYCKRVLATPCTHLIHIICLLCYPN